MSAAGDAVMPARDGKIGNGGRESGGGMPRRPQREVPGNGIPLIFFAIVYGGRAMLTGPFTARPRRLKPVRVNDPARLTGQALTKV